MNHSAQSCFHFSSKVFSSLLILFFSAQFLTGQTTINKDVFTKLIDKTVREVLYETNLDIDPQLAEIQGAIGPDQTYDFSGLNYVDSTVTIYQVMHVDANDPALENPELANAQHVSKITVLPGSGGVMDTTTTYIYSSLENDEWKILGSFTVVDIDFDGSLDSILQFLVTPSLEAVFPVTENSEWADSSNLVSVIDGMATTTSIFIDSSWVEGYGTLITPRGTADALRLRRKRLSFIPFFPNFFDTSNDLEFVTAEDVIAGSIVVEDGRAFHSERTEIEGPTSTFDPPELNFSIRNVSPNPFKEQLEVTLQVVESGEMQFNMISPNGTNIIQLQKEHLSSGEQRVLLDASALPSGMYFLQVKSGRLIQHIPITKI
ncbi:MAG: T9SS type A sorting domain-containing protein [Bacteroidota bacterium]